MHTPLDAGSRRTDKQQVLQKLPSYIGVGWPGPASQLEANAVQTHLTTVHLHVWCSIAA